MGMDNIDQKTESSSHNRLSVILQKSTKWSNPKLFTKMFRSRSSDSVVDSTTKLKTRRYSRVIKDDDSQGIQVENKHVIRKYSKKYLVDKINKSLDEETVRKNRQLNRQTSLDLDERDLSIERTNEKHLHFCDHVDVFNTDKENVEHEPFLDKKCRDCGHYIHEKHCPSREESLNTSPISSECSLDNEKDVDSFDSVDSNDDTVESELKKLGLSTTTDRPMKSQSLDNNTRPMLQRLLFKAFNLKLDSKIKSATSTTSLKNQPTRRRYARVVRDDTCASIDYSNPHIVHKIRQGNWGSSEWEGPLPYTLDSQLRTILKKQGSGDSSHEPKHTRFYHSVEVLENSPDIHEEPLLEIKESE